MRTRTLSLALALGMSLGIGTVSARAADKDDASKKTPEIAWMKSYDAAIEAARKDKKLVMVDFFTDWCGWCKKLDSDTYTDPKVVATSEKLVSYKLDAESKEGIPIAKALGVNGFPTILFIEPTAEAGKGDDDAKDPAKGTVVGRIVGYLPADPFNEKMTSIQQGYQDFPKLKETVKSSPDDLNALGRLAVIYHDRGDAKKAAELLEQGCKTDAENAKGELSKAMNAVADDYQENQKFGKAIPLFEKVVKTAKSPADVAYAQSSIGMCYLQQNKLKEAVPYLQKVVDMEDAPKGDKEQAENFLKAIKAQLGEQKGNDEAESVK